ncbi:hypothetical protein ACK3TF_002987 [Chlorella vulgaris]
MLAAAQGGAQLDLPRLRGSGGMVPPLLYADDTTLLATSAAGQQRQIDLLQRYCEQWGLTVNAAKTKLVLLSGQRTQQAAVDTAQQAALSLAGQPLEAVSNLGITFHASTCIAGAAAPARAVAAQAAMHSCNARCAALGVEAAPLQLRLFSTLVDAVLSYGSEVWAYSLQQLAPLARPAAQPAARQSGCTWLTFGACWGCGKAHHRCCTGGGRRLADVAALAAACSQAVEPGGES